MYPYNLNNVKSSEATVINLAKAYGNKLGGTGRLLTVPEANMLFKIMPNILKGMPAAWWLGTSNNEEKVGCCDTGGGIFMANHTGWVPIIRPVVEFPTLGHMAIYNSNGGSGEMNNSIRIIGKNKFIPPSGKIFKEWNTKADGTGTKYNPGDTVNGNITLYAIWEDLTGVVFVQNGQISSASPSNYLTANFDKNIITGLKIKYTVKVGENTYGPFEFDYTREGQTVNLSAHTNINCRMYNDRIQATGYSGAWYDIYVNMMIAD